MGLTLFNIKLPKTSLSTYMSSNRISLGWLLKSTYLYSRIDDEGVRQSHSSISIDLGFGLNFYSKEPQGISSIFSNPCL